MGFFPLYGEHTHTKCGRDSRGDEPWIAERQSCRGDHDCVSEIDRIARHLEGPTGHQCGGRAMRQYVGVGPAHLAHGRRSRPRPVSITAAPRPRMMPPDGTMLSVGRTCPSNRAATTAQAKTIGGQARYSAARVCHPAGSTQHRCPHREAQHHCSCAHREHAARPQRHKPEEAMMYQW